MSTARARQRLPDRRACTSFTFECAGLTYTASYAPFPDGRVAEIFVSTSGKAGSTAAVVASDSAVIASIALQYGAPLDVLRHAITRDSSGCASSPLGAALDAIAGEEAKP